MKTNDMWGVITPVEGQKESYVAVAKKNGNVYEGRGRTHFEAFKALTAKVGGAPVK